MSFAMFKYVILFKFLLGRYKKYKSLSEKYFLRE